MEGPPRCTLKTTRGISADVLRPLVHFTGDPIEAAYIVNKVSEREVNYKSHKNIKER